VHAARRASPPAGLDGRSLTLADPRARARGSRPGQPASLLAGWQASALRWGKAASSLAGKGYGSVFVGRQRLERVR